MTDDVIRTAIRVYTTCHTAESKSKIELKILQICSSEDEKLEEA